MLVKLIIKLQRLLDCTRLINFVSPLAFRIYLFPIFWMAGTNKLMNIDSTIAWFQSSLGFTQPTLMAYVASLTEVIGAICLITGFAVRWVTIPLMFVMVVAIFSVHWQNGWLTIAHGSSDAAERLSNFLDWLQSNYPQRHEYLTKEGRLVVLNNGVELAVTYFVMLLSLFFTGPGKFLSIDYWIAKWSKYESKI